MAWSSVRRSIAEIRIHNDAIHMDRPMSRRTSVSLRQTRDLSTCCAEKKQATLPSRSKVNSNPGCMNDSSRRLSLKLNLLRSRLQHAQRVANEEAEVFVAQISVVDIFLHQSHHRHAEGRVHTLGEYGCALMGDHAITALDCEWQNRRASSCNLAKVAGTFSGVGRTGVYGILAGAGCFLLALVPTGCEPCPNWRTVR